MKPVKERTNKPKKVIATGLVVSSLLLLMLVNFIRNPFNQHHYYGYEIDSPVSAPTFSLVDLNNKPVELKDYRGKYVYLMFGYLNCTKVCHSQALVLDRLSKEIKAEDVHFVYISMDPERDSIDKLKNYFQIKNHRLSILSGSSTKQLQAIANKFNAPFSITSTSIDKVGAGAKYEISHPGYIFLINPEGYLSMIYTGRSLDSAKIYQDLIQYKSNLSRGCCDVK
jgi:protein SCO1/2